MAKYALSIPMPNPFAEPSARVEDKVAWIIILEHNDVDLVLRRAASLHSQHFPYRIETETLTKAEQAYFDRNHKLMERESEVQWVKDHTTVEVSN